jgi:aminomethyltransferase
MSKLRRTPLYHEHIKLGAKMVEFGGWEMPVQYSGIVKEHRAVRESAGVFDVSHMGEFLATGPDALKFLQKTTANDPTKLGIGRGQYSFFLNENGGTIDDVIVYRMGHASYILVVNASNIEKDWDHLSQISPGFKDLELNNTSDNTAIIALQGPSAEKCLGQHVDRDLSEIGFFRMRQVEFNGLKVRIARTGYTGEGHNGFEIFSSMEDAPGVWSALLTHDQALPCGLGARDTLRIEASLPLYGHELDDSTSPIEAGLDTFVSKLDTYLGSTQIRAQRMNGPKKILVMIEMIDRGIPRQGYALTRQSGENIGVITSGTVAPWIDKNIAMAYVAPDQAETGTELLVQIRNQALRAKVVKRPFFKR